MCAHHEFWGKLKPKFYAKILHQCNKVSSLWGRANQTHTPWRKFVQNVLIGFGQSIYVSPRMSVLPRLTNTEKQIKLSLPQRHNFR